MNITIVGAGNVGTQIAVHCAEKGHVVTIFGSKPELVNKELEIVDENDCVIHKGIIEKATSNEKEAFENADFIFVVMPATLMDVNAKKIEPYVKSGTYICLVPGTGGGECAFKNCIQKGAILCGLQRVPSVARLVEYGKRVRAVGYRDTLHVAALPQKYTNDCWTIIHDIFEMDCQGLPNYLNITLTPSNPILHTTRLFNLYGDYYDGLVYKRVPLFYEEWDDNSSKSLFSCDDEVQKICKRLDMFDLSYVKSLKIHYESPTIEALTNKIRSITGFKGLTSPTKEVDGGYIPDFESRYFTADFSYGLVILVQIAGFFDIDVISMNEVLSWYYNATNVGDEFSFAKYGINNKEDFINFYIQ